MNVAMLFKAVDALMAFREAAKRFKAPPGSSEPPPPRDTMPAAMAAPAAVQGLAGQIETRLTNVVVAALKEAFDRDHARLELERAQMDEQRRRAEAALRLELRRQAADRELGRLRLVAGAAMIGWIASVIMLGAGFVGESLAARAGIAAGWALLLAALGAAFSGQARVGSTLPDDTNMASGGAAGAASLWLLLAGLAATAVSLLFYGDTHMLGRMMVGAAAGTAAAIPMTAYWEYMHAHLPGEPPRPLPPREIVEALAVKAGVSRELSERDMQNLALAAHFGYGAATGALFGLLTPRGAGATVASGALFGLAVWAGSYLGWLPATGVRQPINYDPVARTRMMIGGHVVWGVALGLIAALGTGRRAPAST